MPQSSLSRVKRTLPVRVLCFASIGFCASRAFAQTPAEAAPESEPVLEIDTGPNAPAESEPPADPASGSSAGPAPVSPLPIAEPVEITIAGTRVARTPGSAQVIKKDQLERFEYDDPHAALVQVPGVYVRQEDGVGLRPNIGIRGGNPDRSKKVTLMEDGVLFGPAPYSAPAAYYFPLLTRMVAIKVIKGPSAIAFGPQTVGGAIDFVTRSIPVAPSGALDLGLGQYGYTKAHAHFGASNEQFGFVVEGVRLHNDGFKELGGADTGSTRNEWMVKTSYLLDPQSPAGHQFQLKLGYSDEVSNETYLGLTDADFQENPNLRYPASSLDQMRNHRTAFVLSHQVGAADASWQLTSSAYRQDYAREWRKLNRFRGASISDVLADPESPANAEYYAVLTGEADSVTAGQSLLIGPNDRRFVSEGITSKLEISASSGPLEHRVEAGARLHYDSIVRHHSERGYLMQDGSLVPEDSVTSVTTANEASTLALALHGMDAVSWHDLTVTPGMRIEIIGSELEDHLENERSTHSLVALMPGVGAYYALTTNFGLLSGVYRGFSPPPPGESDAAPEYSLNYEAGARLSDGRNQLEAIGFYNDYENLTNICTFSGGCSDADLDRQFDAGAARIYGVEAYLAHEFVWGSVRFPITGAYTHTRGEFDTTFTSADPIYGAVQAGDEIPYLPRHQASGTLAVEWS
ncbi:MAG TPA: TonB-dependent receptor, partial [Polyangiaceae bacterium]|nr:TonB-dependent receptor [Polyangiaceae bacterium]